MITQQNDLIGEMKWKFQLVNSNKSITNVVGVSVIVNVIERVGVRLMCDVWMCKHIENVLI